jgi:hypothetical protein
VNGGVKIFRELAERRLIHELGKISGVFMRKENDEINIRENSFNKEIYCENV